MAAKYIVRSPQSGAWFRAPGKGSSLDIAEAYPYSEDHPQLADMIHFSRAFGRTLILRQVRGPHEELRDALERDIWATPAPEYVECPDCEGVGDSQERPYFECGTCLGEGRLKLQNPTCVHGIHGHCDQH